MFDYLPVEVMSEILSRLPVKMILQLRCVSKSWNSIITGDSFITFHLNRTIQLNKTNNTHLCLVRYSTLNQGRDDDEEEEEEEEEEAEEEEKEEEHYSLHFDNQSFDPFRINLHGPAPIFESHFRVLGSCNGLVCLSDDVFGYANVTFLWNPTIRKWVELPKPSFTFNTLGPHWLALGYGFDCTTNDYKVVRVVFPDQNDKQGPQSYEIELYSLNEGSWRSIRNATRPPYRIDYRLSSTQAFLNGAVHWICGGYRSYPALICFFDMSREEFHEMKLPPTLESTNIAYMSIFVIGDSLSVIKYSQTANEPVSICVMRKYGVEESWTQAFNIDLDESTVIGFRRNGELLLASEEEGRRWSSSEWDMISVDLLTKGTTSCGIRGRANYFYVGNYTESLVLLN